MKLFAVLIAVIAVLSGALPADARGSYSTSLCRGPVRCFAKVITDGVDQPLVSAQPNGFGPSDFARAYGITASYGRIGIVVAYHNANLLDDLNAFSSRFGEPQLAYCTGQAQNSCLDVRNETGGLTAPVSNSGWALEEDLDAETIHGLCPRCRLEVVEAAAPTDSDLLNAEDTAVRLGANVVSNSWGGPESRLETVQDAHFTAAGVTFVFSSGDNGYGVSYPAASRQVLAVGGTSLALTSYGVTQSAWTGSGSGCSKYEPKPAWQHDASCSRRTVADISADADPATGAAIYHAGRWYVLGGTSLAAPIIAAGVNAAHSRSPILNWYGARGGRSDVTSGNSGSCRASYLCTAGLGFDGPTGWGSPLAGAFGR